MRGLLTHQLIKAILFTLMALILYGTLPGGGLAFILVLTTALRLWQLAEEVLRRSMPRDHWQSFAGEWTRHYEKLGAEQRSVEAAALRIDLNAPPHDLARARVEEAIRAFVPPRCKLDLGSEALGVIAFILLMPGVVALYTRDFVSTRVSQGWMGLLVIAICAVLYGWPHFWKKSPTLMRRRVAWWTIPFLPCLALFAVGIDMRHPYLDPTRSDHTKLAAERVFALRDVVLAGRHADWVMRYARELDRHGETQRAVFFYREALRLDSNDADAQARLAVLEADASSFSGRRAKTPVVSAMAPYWMAPATLAHAERRRIDAQLANIETCTVVVVAVGDVPDTLLDAVSHVIRQELNLPVCVRSGCIPLPEHTRVRGFVTGRQWDVTAIARAFAGSGDPFPEAPLRYLVLTPVDIYGGDANYVFSATFEWGGLVSFARFGDPRDANALCLYRTAKQCLCALLKCFRVPISTNHECVTSYTRSLEEFDAKGNRPSPETLARFQQNLAEINAAWGKQRER